MTRVLDSSEVLHPLKGPFSRVDLRDGTTLHSQAEWNIIIGTRGEPYAVTDGNFIVPWENVRMVMRHERD